MTDHHSHPCCRQQNDSGRLQRFLKTWFFANSILAGLLSLVWLILRSGSKPSRLSYPCQQAAFSTAGLALASPFFATLIAVRKRVAAGLRTRAGVATVAFVLIAPLCVWGTLEQLKTSTTNLLMPSADYRAQVFQVTDCPQDPVGDHFPGLDNLLELMSANGTHFYEASVGADLSGPQGIIGADDVVVIKINYQWEARGGTNTDLLRALIRAIVDHPAGFTGEVVVGENTQSVSHDNYDRSLNNAQDRGQSPRDVVGYFEEQGWAVSISNWTGFRFLESEEYSDGRYGSGYVVLDYDGEAGGCVSYPKFRTRFGTYVSLRHGVWNESQGTYDRNRLKFINLPVLKSHSAVYGATACVKNYMGVVTNELSTASHGAIRTGILGALLAEIRPADLNILDCIWINADPYDGPWTGYSAATRKDQLVASTDPVAADIWAVTNILVPTFIENGFSPPWPRPSATPDDPESNFRRYLDRSMQQILAGGFDVTNDLSRIDTFTWDGRSVVSPPRRSGGRVSP